MSERKLSGCYLISYDNCTINLNDIMVSNTIQQLTGRPIQLPLDGLTITKDQQIFTLSLEHLNHLQTETRKDLEMNNSFQWTPLSILETFSFTPIIIGLAVFFGIFVRRKAMKIQFTQQSKEVPATRDITIGFQQMSSKDVIRTEPHY